MGVLGFEWSDTAAAFTGQWDQSSAQGSSGENPSPCGAFSLGKQMLSL